MCLCVNILRILVFFMLERWLFKICLCEHSTLFTFNPVQIYKTTHKKSSSFRAQIICCSVRAFVYVCPISCLFIRLFVYFFVPLPMCWLSMKICVDFHFLPWIVYAYTNWKKILTNSVYSVVVYTTPWVMDTTILNVYCKLPITFRMLSSWATKIHTYCIFCRGIVSDYLYVCTTHCARGCFGMRFAVRYLLVSMILLYSESTRLYISLGP